jgi:hypothetical protein
VNPKKRFIALLAIRRAISDADSEVNDELWQTAYCLSFMVGTYVETNAP